jgi:hypothetical protein
LSRLVPVLLYLEHEWLYRRFDMKAGYAGDFTHAQNALTLFGCPESKTPACEPTTHYVAMAGLGANAASRPAGAGSRCTTFTVGPVPT